MLVSASRRNNLIFSRSTARIDDLEGKFAIGATRYASTRDACAPQNSLPRLARAGPQFRIELGFCALRQMIGIRI